MASDFRVVSAAGEDPSPSTSEVTPNHKVSQPRPCPVSSSKKKLSYISECIDYITE